MSLIAARLNRIKPSPSSMAAQRARELRALGRDIVGLTSGEPDFDMVKRAYADAGFDSAEVRPFIHDMADQFERADVLVCRAGATTAAEVAAAGKAAIFVPFPFATDDHQRKNAEALVGSVP